MPYFRICPSCGAALDPCERCDCVDAEQPQAKPPQYRARDQTGSRPKAMHELAGRSGTTEERRRPS